VADRGPHGGIHVPKEKLADFCRRWRITELSLFGSVLRADFRPESDIDVLVTFAPDAAWRFYDLIDMREELERIFGRSVDLVERRLVETSENYIRRKHILSNLETIYVA
jgi:predicted nucleotidyltransferase